VGTVTASAFTTICFNADAARADEEGEPKAVATEAATVTTEAVTATVTEATKATPKIITPCLRRGGGKNTNCISTANVRQLDLYSPPWTFNVTPEEAMARLKGIVDSDPTLERVVDNNSEPYYMRVTVNRKTIFKDEIQFILSPSDKVVFFRSEDIGDNAGSVSDFGAIKKRLESIRQQSNGVFGSMGESINSADTAPTQNGPVGQLKAFYGFQSGKGFEDVFLDD